MYSRTDTRGQAVTLGVVLLFGLFILALALVQVNLVPQQNKAVEFGAYQQATDDMVDLHSTVLATSSQGTQGGVNVKTGAEYPARILTFNPGRPAGGLALSKAETITIENGISVETDVEDYWDGDPRDFDTRHLVFSPAYNEFAAQPVALTGQFVYRVPDDNDGVVLTKQTLIRGNQLTVVTLTGDLGTATAGVPVAVDPVSTGTQTVTLISKDLDDGDPNTNEGIVLVIPSELPALTWEREVLAGEPNVVAVEDVAGSNAVRITLRAIDPVSNDPIAYELRMSRVELRERNDANVASPTAPAYVVTTDGDGTTISNGQSARLTFQVRDKYNNPVSSVELGVNVPPVAGSSPGDVTPNPIRTDSSGHATVTYEPASGFDGDATIDVTCSTCLVTGAANVTTSVVQVSTDAKETNRPPSVSVTQIRQTNNNKNDGDSYNVTLALNDPDDNLATVRVWLIDPDNKDGVDDPYSGPVSRTLTGGTAVETVSISVASGDKNLKDYYLLVEVVDDDGLIDAEGTFVSGQGNSSGNNGKMTINQT